LQSECFHKALVRRGLSPEDLLSGRINTFIFPFESLLLLKHFRCCGELLSDNESRYAPLLLNRPAAQVDTLPFAWIEGLIIVVNFTKLKVHQVVDEYVPCPPLPTKVPEDAVPVFQPTLKPLVLSMPEGPSWSLCGHKLEWANWRLRLSWHPRTGLQLYRIFYRDNGRDRSVLYKASVTEANVYYNVDDVSVRSFVSPDSNSYPLLARTVSLIPGTDTPDFAQFLDIPMVQPDGSVISKTNAIAIYEQFATKLSFRAVNADGSQTAGVDRQLVLKYAFSGVIYYWTFLWIFSTNGTIEARVDVSGRDLYRVAQKDTLFAELISRNNLAFNHTHIYNWRFDFDIDGAPCNQVIEENQYQIRSKKKNPCGQAVRVFSRVLKTELEAVRNLNIKRNRSWTVVNPSSLNRLGRPHGYSLLPIDTNGTSLAAPHSWVHRHYSFTNHHLHVTRYCQDEQFASGNFPILAKEDVGLGKYVSRDASIDGEDVVVWYTELFSHHGHTEDFPLVETLSRGLQLVPHDFFEVNPTVPLVAFPPSTSSTTGGGLNF
jgi:primary-amine oxidase